MKVLVVGGGGREHALVWKLAQSPKVKKIYCAPGNAGTAAIAENISVAADDVENLLAFAMVNSIDLTVVGPEAPLMEGIADRFQSAGLKIFAPSKRAAAIEGSKALSKDLMAKYNIPTAKYATFTAAADAIACIQEWGAPIVVKADGLAAGKGVVVAFDEETAIQAVKDIMEDNMFGDAGSVVVVEEYLDGEEVSILAFTDGFTVVPMVSAQDHKRIFDGDEGPNTGGMGAYSPAPIYTDALAEEVQRTILQPTIDALRAEGRLYQGVIYAGLMVTADGPKVLEYNARFGDPETQPIMMRLKTDLVEIIEAILDGKLQSMDIQWYEEPAVCVVMVAGGYPGKYAKGEEILGLAGLDNEKTTVFHAGTALKNEKIVTAGGRVLGVTTRAATIAEAIQAAYEVVGKISFKDAFYRKDIGHRALNRK